jgi:hypothetical protein
MPVSLSHLTSVQVGTTAARNVGIPANITPGPAVELVLVQSGVASYTVTLVVR